VERLFLAIMDIRARSISFASRPRRPEGPPDHERAGETIFSISSFLLADLGGEADYGILCNSLACILGYFPRDARFIATLLCQHGPGDPRQFVGESSRQHIGMQALRGTNDPAAEAVLWPVRRPH
jgi:hypothetical protein